MRTLVNQNFPPIDQETRSHVETACAAFHLLRKPQTLRAYACLENGPIRPIRINGRLAWSVAEIRKLVNGVPEMEKGQLPIFAELTLADTKDSIAKATLKFTGTNNPRHLRVIHSLLIRPRKREEIDRIAGASNGPELIAELRRRGLHAPCHRTPGTDRDGYHIKFGVYKFDDSDRRKLNRWLAGRK